MSDEKLSTAEPQGELDRAQSSHSSDIDQEKQSADAPTKVDFLVEWDNDNDPLNPRSFAVLRKWLYVVIISAGSLLITTSSTMYASTYAQITKEFNSSDEVATLGLSLFVLGLAVAPMVLSPLSEFYGRRPIYIISILFFLVFTIPCAVARNIQTLLIARFLCGVSGSAFLTVAAGTVSDLFLPQHIQAPMMLFTITPFLGPVLGPLVSGFINQFTSWRWTFYVLLIWSGVMFVAVLFVPETYHPVLLARKAASIRTSTGNEEYRSSSELALQTKSISKTILHSLYRPFQLLVLEPMCLLLCMYSALLLGILYLFFGAFPLVFETNHGFELWQTGMTFLGLMVGMFVSFATMPLWKRNYLRLVADWKINLPDTDQASPRPESEFRLPPAIAGAILVPIGLFWFAWTTYASVHWIVPIIGSSFFAAGMMLVFSGIWTFLVDAYPTYAASAMAANTFARCVLAAAFPLFGDQMYERLGYQWASSLLAFLALGMMPFPYLFFRYGKQLRARSRFATS